MADTVFGKPLNEEIEKLKEEYHAPWELIRTDTFTNASAGEHVVSVDGNGNAFELTDLVLQVTIPKDIDVTVGAYGAIDLYYSSSSYITVLTGNVSGTKSNPWYASVHLRRDNNACEVTNTQFSESGNNRAIYWRNQNDLILQAYNIVKVRFRDVTGQLSYNLYGKRKPA